MEVQQVDGGLKKPARLKKKKAGFWFPTLKLSRLVLSSLKHSKPHRTVAVKKVDPQAKSIAERQDDIKELEMAVDQLENGIDDMNDEDMVLSTELSLLKNTLDEERAEMGEMVEPEAEADESREEAGECNRKSTELDGISKLPDEIIVEILSLLTLKEAIATSILSRRWRYLWTLVSKSLCFDSGKLLLDNAFNDKKFVRDLPVYTAKFVNWVNYVLNVHQGTVVDKFKVCMPLDATYTSAVNSWVELAIKKRVQILDLTFTSLRDAFPRRHPYVFPSFDKLNLPPDYTLIRLKTLRLMAVDVSEHVIHHFLKQCPLLEQLSLIHSNSTLNLKIHGTDSLKLKHLDLYRCNHVENLEISAPNLISFSYTGPKKQVPFRNVPLLTELCIGDEYCESFISEAPKHLSYLSQLTKLTLILPSEVIVKRRYRKNFPKLDNLKHLELRVSVAHQYPLIFLTYLIKAAPKLSKFVMKQLLFIGESKYYDGKEFCYEEYKGSGKKKFWHECLQEIEFVGFTGHPTDFQVAVRFLEISSVLEKMTIDTRHPGQMYWPDVVSDDFAKSRPRDGDGEIPKGTKEIAHKLKSYVPPGVQFEIILDDVFLP